MWNLKIERARDRAAMKRPHESIHTSKFTRMCAKAVLCSALSGVSASCVREYQRDINAAKASTPTRNVTGKGFRLLKYETVHGSKLKRIDGSMRFFRNLRSGKQTDQRLRWFFLIGPFEIDANELEGTNECSCGKEQTKTSLRIMSKEQTWISKR